MRSRETALGATIRFFERYAGIDRAGKTHRPSGPGLPDGGVGVLPDAVPDRLLGAWIADDVCACEAFFIEGKTKSEPCGLPERGALPVFAFACACGLYFARGGRLADVPEPGRPEVWLLFLQFQTVLRLVRAARIRGVSPPPVDVFGFERYPETVRRLKACVEGGCDGRARLKGRRGSARRPGRSSPRSRTRVFAGESLASPSAAAGPESISGPSQSVL